MRKDRYSSIFERSPRSHASSRGGVYMRVSAETDRL